MATIRVTNLSINKQAGVLLPTSFSDSMAVAASLPRNQISPPTDNWLLTLLSGDTPTAVTSLGAFQFGQALTGGGNGLGANSIAFGGAPTYVLATALVPVSMYVGSKFYTALQKFVQIKFDSFTTYQMGIGICNFLDSSGTGAAGSNNINHDCYLVDIAGQPLRLLRFNSVAAPTTLQAASSLAVNDVVRASFDFTNPSQVTIVVKKNGTTQYTINDTAAGRLPSSGLAFPVIAMYSVAGAGNCLASQFSCGVGL